VASLETLRLTLEPQRLTGGLPRSLEGSLLRSRVGPKIVEANLEHWRLTLEQWRLTPEALEANPDALEANPGTA
jgi:hypothetical protein